MRYEKFHITGYRGLKENTIIDISKTSLYPIIGKNESGKTTILEAIYSFDYANDNENNGKHLLNIDNLYSTLEKNIEITAEIEIDDNYNFINLIESEYEIYKNEFYNKHTEEELNIKTISIDDYKYTNWIFVKAYQILEKSFQQSKKLKIIRNLRTKLYSIEILKEIIDISELNKISEKIVVQLPYTLYFDDFRDRIPEKLYITNDKKNPLYSNWIEYIDELFKETRSEYSVFLLPDKQDSIRRSIIKEAQNKLNKKLITEWSNYQFESSNTIKLQIECIEGDDISYLQFKIIELAQIDGHEEERFFNISDRSKGFYWYINFMIKLHFNPNKRGKDDNDTIYLLDEPGSYLHTYALNKLAEQLKNLSITNKVIYCTHSHNLLNPNFIPINSIHLSEKTKEGVIQVKPLDHKGIIRPNKNSAYQSIYDALEVRPPLIEYDFDNVIILEGIYDYYSFKMFTNENIHFFPCVSASSIINQIPYMIFLGKKYLAVWDNDNEGRARLKKATELFGEIEANKFITLENINSNTNTRLEEYYNQDELNNFNIDVFGRKNSFEKSILNLFYSNKTKEYINKYFILTTVNFKKAEKIFMKKLGEQNR